LEYLGFIWLRLRFSEHFAYHDVQSVRVADL
jgi:hypothetical protein